MDISEKTKITERIKSLPKGSISVKTINGRQYEYWQFRENGRQVSRRVKGIELETLRRQIEERRQLESMLKGSSNRETAKEKPDTAVTDPFSCIIRTGDELMRFAEPVKDFRRRKCFDDLLNYVKGISSDRVFILFGLRRTGKTTMIRQMLLDMDDEMRSRTAFIQITPKDSLADLNRDLRLLEKQDFRSVFIDEVTLIEDFIEGAALFSDVFAASGMKIILSGTDSLGFVFSEDEQLYDRCYMTHTTFIPYSEFEYVLGISGIDEYIRYGGTMSLGGRDYNSREMPFATASGTNEYIDSAIAGNIQHSLKNYRYGGHFRHLQKLYDAGELTNVINRVVEDINHRFTVEVITDTFRSHDLGISKNNLRHDREMPTSALDDIDSSEVTERVMDLLEILNKKDQSIEIDEVHAAEIEEYLKLLDLVKEIPVINDAAVNKSDVRTVITQPGLRHSQAEALISSLLRDESFRSIGVKERMRISGRIMSEIEGRMMEDIVLLETMLANPGKEVFVLKFAVGEFDMVVFDPESISCRIYEIKHSSEQDPAQRRHLNDPEKCRQTERQYGTIDGRYVIYRGEDTETDGVRYLNVEKYLCGCRISEPDLSR